MLKPCKNSGGCNSTDNGKSYNCSCLTGFSGKQCEFDHRPYKSNICWNNGTHSFFSTLTNDKIIISGTSHQLPDSTFNCCTCVIGWEGCFCERKKNYCYNIICENKGVCWSLTHGFVCKCLGGSYSGEHCEITATKIKIYKIVSKSFAYIAIIAMASVAVFVIVMDILKYCFGIDPVHAERELIRRQKQAKKRKPVIQKFIYVNAPSPPPSEQSIPTIEEASV
jgi:hypothetical protein